MSAKWWIVPSSILVGGTTVGSAHGSSPLCTDTGARSAPKLGASSNAPPLRASAGTGSAAGSVTVAIASSADSASRTGGRGGRRELLG